MIMSVLGHTKDADADDCGLDVEVIFSDNGHVAAHAVLCLRRSSHVWYRQIRRES